MKAFEPSLWNLLFKHNQDPKYSKLWGVVKHYLLRLIPMVLLLGVTLLCLGACSTVEYIDTGLADVQSKAVQAVLEHCVTAQVGLVGETNESLVKAYVRSSESLMVCKQSTYSVLEYLRGGYYE